MATPPRICVVGSANVDLTFRTPRLPLPGETLAGRAVHIGMGGKGANQAVAASRLGAKVSLVACVGNDPFGLQAIHSYQVDGIDTAFVIRDANVPTGTAAILVDDNAQNSIVVVAGANGCLSAEMVQAAASLIRNSDILLCQLETPVDATVAAFEIARSAGVRTILTPAPAATLSDQFLQLCDLCVPNQTDLRLLTGRSVDGIHDVESAANDLRSRGVKNVVVTLGERGVLLVGEGDSTHIPAVQVDAVDTTGAGDAFTAGLAVHLASGRSLDLAARHATVVAALTVTRIGTQSAFPLRGEVDQWLAKTK